MFLGFLVALNHWGSRLAIFMEGINVFESISSADAKKNKDDFSFNRGVLIIIPTLFPKQRNLFRGCAFLMENTRPEYFREKSATF